MGLTAITIENFKGIGESVTIPLRPLTLLFGANSAGKSTIIQALQYAWEVLENRNADVDRTRLGGEAIDLGGFKNLVHGHDLSRQIAITLHYTGVPNVAPYLPPSNYFSEAFRGDWVDGGYINANSYLNINILAVRLKTGWDHGEKQASICSYEVSFNEQPFARIGKRDTGALQLQVDVWHPLLSKETCSAAQEFGEILKNTIYFFAGYDIHDDEDSDYTPSSSLTPIELEIALEELGELESSPFEKQRWPLLHSTDLLPAWGEPISLGDSEYSDTTPARGAKEELVSLLSQLICGAGHSIVNELRGLRYLGPLRVIPDRLQQSPIHLARERWADGLGAWDLLVREGHHSSAKIDPKSDPEHTTERSSASLIDVCSTHLNETLGLGYTVRREERIQLPRDGDWLVALRLLADQFDDRRASDVYGLLADLETIPTLTTIQLHDEKNDLDVEPMDVGVGISQMLPVIVGAVDQDCSIFAIEQPELHIHPAIQSKMGDLFLREVLGPHAKGRIFLIETHSEHLILRLLRRIRQTTNGESEEGNPKVRPEDVQVLYVEGRSDGVSIVPLEITPDGDFAQDWPKGFFTEREEDLF